MLIAVPSLVKTSTGVAEIAVTTDLGVISVVALEDLRVEETWVGEASWVLSCLALAWS